MHDVRIVNHESIIELPKPYQSDVNNLQVLEPKTLHCI